MQQDSTSGAPVPPVWGSDHAETFLRADTVDGHPDYAPLILTGTIDWWQRHVSHQGKTWAEGMLRLASGERVRFQVFPNVYPVCGHLLIDGQSVVMHARLDLRETRPRAIVRALNQPENVTAAGTVLSDGYAAELTARADAGYDPEQFTSPLPAIHAALVDVHRPDRPRDGDCLTYEPKVRAALIAAGLVAHEATVTAWADPAQATIAFLHKATACAGHIVDVTARQFSPVLPAVMVDSVGRYAFQLARAAGVGSVTVTIHTAEGSR